ncbi:hypothetical protein PIROE2DRAFT_60113 [Piromyces sp. E2]|nr:hypothetical protein PIROE2DRAFT_60113 [Piromyces sp. E2]|eukprot:OUM65317.1 hypothetical protein PIROE2DRAFT_60113 [Piromyces sp. E2]
MNDNKRSTTNQTNFLIVGLGNPEKKLEFTRHNIGKFLVNRIAEEYGGTNWITKNSYGGSISLLKYKVKQRENKSSKKNKKKSKSNETNQKESIDKKVNNSKNLNLNVENRDQTDLEKQTSKESISLNENSEKETQKKEITFHLFFLKPKYYINESGKGVLKAIKKFDIPKENVIVLHDNLDKKLGHIQLKECGSANGHNGIRSMIEYLETDKFYRVRIGIDRPPKTDKNKSIYNNLVGDYVLEPFKENEFIMLNNEIYNRILDILKDLAYKKFEQICDDLLI